MTRRRTALVVAVAIIVAAGGWFGFQWMRPAARPVDRTGATAGRDDAVPQGRNQANGNTSPGRPFVVSLRVNSTERVVVTPGSPLFFDVTLTGARSGGLSTIGDSRRPWSSLVRLVRAGTDEAAPWPTQQIGRNSLSISAGQQKPEIKTENSDTAQLERGRSNYLMLAVAPDATTNTAAGSYEIQAVVEQGSWLPWQSRARVASAPVTIIVSSAGNERLERQRLALAARYHLWTKRSEEAVRIASDLLQRDKKDVGAAILLGDALADAGRPQEALDAYRTALANSPRTYESPTLLYERIARVSQQLPK